MMKAATTGASVKMPSSSFSFRGAVSITQALLYFHILLAEASEPARRSKDNREQIQKRNSNGSELRYVRKEVELEDILMYNDILGIDEPLPESTTRTTTLPAPWADSTPWADSNEIVDGEGNSMNWDKLGDSNWVYVDDDDYFPNITEADDIFSGGATLESQVPSMSPSEINFQPVPQLENSEDSPLIELQVPSDNSIDPKIDQEPGSPVPVVSTTSEPSPPPIFPPTRAPTKPPTNKPTRVPTAVPTEAPTYEPTYEPTRIPTSQPSASPTRNPSALPTKTPTNKPTEVPTKLPTELPTELPTPRPTQQPTRTPSLRPTFRPTHLPTGGPTEPPTRIPTPRPTRKPTLRPTHLPTTEPTPRPSPVPTISNEPSPAPSGAPSLPLQTNDVSGVMDLSPLATELQRRDSLGWETVTENFIMRFLLSPEAGLSLKDTEIRADIVKQSILVQEGTGTTRRFLQDNSVESKKESLVIQYNLIIDYRSTSYDYDINELVWSAFDTPEKQAKYIKDLQDRSGVFDPVTEVEVEVDGYSPPRTPVPKPPDEGVDLAVIIGSSVGGVAFIMLIVLLCLRSRTGESVDEKAIAETQATPSTAKNIKVSTEILVEPQDDVSTLGDPMFGQGGMIMGGIERDEMTATVGDDYDYTKHYRNARGPLSISGTTNTRDRTTSEDMSKMSSVQSASMKKLGKMGEHIFADDASFEEQFKDPEERIDVVAPAGKLGMVIDTPNGGIPVVHAIKDTSVLVDQVRVGDRLLSVDGEDCTGMTAMQVSKLISLKSEKPARVLVFARSSTNTNPAQ